jgi:2C-methyl-D-erythritol 2,4-cyclodiphosphate synthase
MEKRFPDLHKTFKGNIYRLMRNYFLFVTEEGFDIKNFDLGFFSATWNFEKDIETIYAELSLALKWFYKFNYQLWKIDDLKKK